MSAPDPDMDNFMRRLELVQAFRAKEPVVIDGVTFDLRWDIDKDYWRPVAPIGTYGRQTLRFGPRIVFPWTPPEWIEHWRDNGGYLAAPAGSTIKTALVRAVPIEGSFEVLEVEDNRECQLMYLWVFSPDGQMKPAEPPLALFARTATPTQIDLGEFDVAYGGLVSKLEEMLDCDDLEERLDKPKPDFPRPGPDMPLTYRRAVLTLHEAIQENDEKAYVAFGYLMGRAEAELQLLDLALREHKATGDRARGGRTRHETSRRDTEPLRDLAKRLIRCNANMSLGGCARRVSEALPDSWRRGRDPEWIKGHIRELFEKRSKGVGYRPRREWVNPSDGEGG